jgi:hypothetical protein
MRILLALAATAAAGALVALPAIAADNGKITRFAQAETLGYYRGQTVAYLDLGPVKLAAGNKTAPIWVFTNGADGQRNIIDTVPGRTDYTPLWSVRMVTWKEDATPRIVRAAADVRKAVADGEATVAVAPVVVNCPVL